MVGRLARRGESLRSIGAALEEIDGEYTENLDQLETIEVEASAWWNPLPRRSSSTRTAESAREPFGPRSRPA